MKKSPANSLPSDFTLLTAGSLSDVPRIASVATRSVLIDALRWCDGNTQGNAARRELLAEALRKGAQS